MEKIQFSFNGRLVKNFIPPVAIKVSNIPRPYYPFEVVKQIQKDVETP